MILICEFCGNDEDSSEAEIDKFQRGWWCSHCDGFSYLTEPETRHRFTLLLEDRQKKNTTAPDVRVSLKKQMSVLRYPGGKSKFIPYLYSKLQATKTKKLVSAYAGSASAELAFLEAGVVKELVLNDKDVGIYSLFWTIQHAPHELIYRIRQMPPSHREFFRAQAIIKADYEGCTVVDAAWYTLLVNRLAYSGIYRANPLGGRKGSKGELLSRWNPDELCRRINRIHELSDHMTVLNSDACELIEESYWNDETTIFLDPPYVKKGKQLYRCYYNEDEHIRLNELLDSLHQGMPGADIILCYDNDPLIQRIYQYPTIEVVGRIYSV